MAGKQEHPFHIIDPSPWPLVGAFAGLFFAVGMILYMHDVTVWGLYGGVAAILYTMYGWWKDVVHEAHVQKAHTAEARTGLRMGMALFISSEAMFFFAFFWAYFNASIFPTEAIGSIWPPANIEVPHTFDLPFLNTLILLLSGTTVTWAHHALLEGKRKELVQGLGYTVLLGILFLGLQVFEYAELAFGFKDGIYPTVFYMATGFHGFHVMVGTIFLAVCYFRAKNGHFTPDRHVGFESAAWYWHFVDVVWLFLFVAVYWWGNA